MARGDERSEARTRVARGRLAEDAAAAWLERKGWEILARNVWYRVGELDIVADDGTQLVFVEVRSRGRRDVFRAEDSVRYPKQMRLTRAAHLFMGHYRGPRLTARFDVLAVDGPTGEVLAHHRAAFEAVGPEVF